MGSVRCGKEQDLGQSSGFGLTAPAAQCLRASAARLGCGKVSPSRGGWGGWGGSAFWHDASEDSLGIAVLTYELAWLDAARWLSACRRTHARTTWQPIGLRLNTKFSRCYLPIMDFERGCVGATSPAQARGLSSAGRAAKPERCQSTKAWQDQVRLSNSSDPFYYFTLLGPAFLLVPFYSISI